MLKGPHKFISLGLTLLLIVFVFQWEILQLGAWASMIRDYSQDSTLKLAVAETFSGERPCEKCKKLARSQTGTQSPTEINASPTFPPDLEAPEPLNLLPLPPGNTLRPSIYDLTGKKFSNPPPTPPPRFFLS